MALIKVRNTGGNILFIDSIGLILRPLGPGRDSFSLVDETKAKGDPEFMKCALLGSIEFCAIDKDFPKKEEPKKEEKVDEPKKVEKVDPSTKKDTKKIKADAKTTKKSPVIEERVGNEIEEFVEPPEPKNSDPVIVVPGEKGKARTAKAKTYKLADMPMPRFIKESDIRDIKSEDVDAETQGEKDIDLSKIDD